MNAYTFLRDFALVLPETWPPEAPQSWSQWSTHIFERLYRVAVGANMSCVSQYVQSSEPAQSNISREVLYDMCWFADPYFYALPAVVIEHENSSAEPAFLFDMWKLMFAQAPLRVMIGYTPTPESQGARVAKVNSVAAESRWSFPMQVEDLIIIGTNSMPTPRAFEIYLRPVGARQFYHLGELGTSISETPGTKKN